MAVVFVAVLVPAAATLVWLGLKLLDQDRILHGQRVIEYHDAAAEAVVRTLAQSLADAERRRLEGQGIVGSSRWLAFASDRRDGRRHH